MTTRALSVGCAACAAMPGEKCRDAATTHRVRREDAERHLEAGPGQRRRASMALALGTRIRTLRAAAGVSQADLAKLIGTHRPLVSRVERGEHLPTLDVLALYARALDVQLSTLVGVLDGF